MPIEDLAALVIESGQVSLTSSVLSRLAENDTLVLVCDGKHMPCLVGLPAYGHSRQSGVQRIQLATSEPFRKRCWQALVRRKIWNQAECLRLLEREGSERLRAISRTVTSGDTANVEAQAARFYFQRVFGREFARGNADGVNSALDYAYAILRAFIARALAAHGLLLTIGVHHSSELNPMNLADDFLEPLRPLADLMVAMMDRRDELNPAVKRELQTLLMLEMRIDGASHGLTRVTERMAASFQSACRSGDARMLRLPELIPPLPHRYE